MAIYLSFGENEWSINFFHGGKNFIGRYKKYRPEIIAATVISIAQNYRPVGIKLKFLGFLWV